MLFHFGGFLSCFGPVSPMGDTHTCAYPHISCETECSNVTAVNSDPGDAPGNSRADQNLV